MIKLERKLSLDWFNDLEIYMGALTQVAAKNFDGNALVVYSTDDTVVSSWASQNVADALDCATLIVYADGHSYSFYGKDPNLINTVNNGSVNFFAQTLWLNE